MKRIVSVLAVLVVIAVVCLVCGPYGWALFRFAVWDHFEMQQAVKKYDGATLLFEESDSILTHTDQYTGYFWSSDPIETVKASYENSGLSFVAGTGQKEWWISVYNKNNLAPTVPAIDSTIADITHQSLCKVPFAFQGIYWANDEQYHTLEPERTREYGCITVTLVRANQPNLCTLLPVFPGNRGFQQYGTVTPYENCSRFPKQGTLIIFNYYLDH